MIRFILALVISAILAMGLILLASKHGFTAECLTVNTLKSQVVSRLPEAIIIEMGGTETKGFLGNYNAFPPRSEIAGDYLLILKKNGNRLTVVVIFRQGCYDGMLFIDNDKFRQMMDGL